jgi:hypothetical protein
VSATELSFREELDKGCLVFRKMACCLLVEAACLFFLKEPFEYTVETGARLGNGETHRVRIGKILIRISGGDSW